MEIVVLFVLRTVPCNDLIALKYSFLLNAFDLFMENNMEDQHEGSSPKTDEEQQKYKDVNRGPLTGVRIKPAGAIPTGESGFEDLDGFWSPSAVDNTTPPTERLIRIVQHGRDKAARKEVQQKDLEDQFEKDVEKGITIQMHRMGREPSFTPVVGVQYASPPTTTPKRRPIREKSTTLTPVSLGSYVTPRRAEQSEKPSALTSPNSLPSSVRNYSSDGENPSSEITNTSRKSVSDIRNLDQHSPRTPETDANDDDQAGALDDLLASSKKARDRQISLANKLKTPSPSGFTTTSEISKTPKSVQAGALEDLLASSKKARDRQLSLANKLRTPSPSGFTTASEISKTPKSVQAGALDDLLASSKKARDRQQSLANKLRTPSPSGFMTASEISKTPKSVSFADRIATFVDASGQEDDQFNHNNDDDGGESDGDGPGFQMVQEEDNVADHVEHEDDDVDHIENEEDDLEDEANTDESDMKESVSVSRKQRKQSEEDDLEDEAQTDESGMEESVSVSRKHRKQNEEYDLEDEAQTDESGMEESVSVSRKQRKQNEVYDLEDEAQTDESGMEESDLEDANQNRIQKEKKSKTKKRHLVEEDTPDLSSKTPQRREAPTQYKLVSVDQYKDPHSEEEESEDENEGRVRRSKRAKFPPLRWWKNERLIYESGDKRESFARISAQADIDMPVVTKVLSALPTPAKPIRPKKAMPKKIRKSDGDSADKAQPSSIDVLPFNSSRLRSKYNIFDGNKALVWDEETGDLKEKKLVSYSSDMTATRLPKTVSRGKQESDVVGFASQAFNVSVVGDNIPGWISGNLLLPPRAIKDPEGVGLCSQVFFVGDCQPDSVEFSIANPEETEYVPATAQRFLLSKGDYFHVPPSNIYRLENHSRTTECKVFWTIIRPLS